MSIGPKHWNILVVDDEPDVLKLSQMLMRDLKVDDLSLNIQTATSKAEAIMLLNGEESWLPQLAVAFIDVVMESDTAGLELCQYIREEMKNRVSQLYIRTGQPGVAPERTVIDRYDISGYFTKAEVTEDKLYSLVKSGVRQFYATQVLQAALTILERLIDVGDSKQKLIASASNLMQSFYPPDAPADNAALFTVDGQPVFGPLGWDEPTALALKEKLDASAGIPLSPDGDKYVRGEDNHLLIKVAANPPRPEAFILFKYRNYYPENRIITAISFLRNFATLWARAA